MIQSRTSTSHESSGHNNAFTAGPRSRLHDSRNFHVSLKQWKMLHAVYDFGGFADAAEFLHISQSSVSYSIARLQEQLGVRLLKLEGRKARLTDAGKIMLDPSRRLLRDALELEALADNLGRGGKAELRLVVDHSFPSHLVMQALSQFSCDQAKTQVFLTEAATANAEKALVEQAVDLAITRNAPVGFSGDPLIEVECIAVAHPNHSLFRIGRTLTASDFTHQVEVKTCNARDSACRGSREMGGLSQWRVGSLDTAVQALIQGFCYAWLPKFQVQKWLDRGSLKMLPLAEGSAYKLHFYLMYGRPCVQDSSVARLAEVLRHVATSEWGCNKEFVLG